MIADPEGPSFIVRTVGHRRYSDGAFVTHDPTETWAAQDFTFATQKHCSFLRQSMVYCSFYRHAQDLRREESQGHSHPTARIHIHTGRRGGRVAARGARAAAEGADDRRAGYWQYK